MRNFVPLSVFAAAASLAALGTPSLQIDRLAAKEPTPTVAPASSGEVWHVKLPQDSAGMRYTLPACERNAGCAIRRPMI